MLKNYIVGLLKRVYGSPIWKCRRLFFFFYFENMHVLESVYKTIWYNTRVWATYVIYFIRISALSLTNERESPVRVRSGRSRGKKKKQSWKSTNMSSGFFYRKLEAMFLMIVSIWEIIDLSIRSFVDAATKVETIFMNSCGSLFCVHMFSLMRLIKLNYIIDKIEKL